MRIIYFNILLQKRNGERQIIIISRLLIFDYIPRTFELQPVVG